MFCPPTPFPLTENNLETLRADVAFLGADAGVVGSGLNDFGCGSTALGFIHQQHHAKHRQHGP